jgi:hypothetical protein
MAIYLLILNIFYFNKMEYLNTFIKNYIPKHKYNEEKPNENFIEDLDKMLIQIDNEDSLVSLINGADFLRKFINEYQKHNSQLTIQNASRLFKNIKITSVFDLIANSDIDKALYLFLNVNEINLGLFCE